MPGDSKLVARIEASIERALGEKMRTAWRVEPDQSLPPEWLELVAQIEGVAELEWGPADSAAGGVSYGPFRGQSC